MKTLYSTIIRLNRKQFFKANVLNLYIHIKKYWARLETKTYLINQVFNVPNKIEKHLSSLNIKT